MEEITADDLAAAEAQLVQIKETGTPEEKKAAMEAVASLRQQFRVQEEAAGRRTGLVGGDAQI